MRINFREFEGGIWVRGPHDQNPQGTLRRARGIDTVRQNELRSRGGSRVITSIEEGDITAITYFADKFWFGTNDGKLYRVDDGVAVLVKEGFDGTKLRFVQAPPQVGFEDYLFVSGGGDGVGLIKIDKDSNVTPWGVDPPPDGFTVEKAPQKEKEITSTAVAGWFKVKESGTSGSTLEASELAPTGFKVTMHPKSLAAFQRSFGAAVDLTTFEPTQYDPFIGSSDADYIQFKIFISDPANLDFVQIGFDINGTLFISNFFTTFLEVVPPGQQFSQIGPSADDTSKAQALSELLEEKQVPLLFRNQPNPVGSGDSRHLKFGAILVARTEVRRTHGRAIILPVFGTEVLRPEVDGWTTVRVSRARFHRSGTAENIGWEDALAVRFYLRTKELNVRTGEKIQSDTVIHIDDLRYVGGYGTRGASYFHAITYRNSMTGSRSNPNPSLVETIDVDREAFVIRKLPINPTLVPLGVDQIELWRSIGDGSQLFLSRRFQIAELEADRNNPGLPNYEGLTVGEAFDPINDIIDMNRRDPIDGVGTVSTTNGDRHVTFSDPNEGGKVRQDDLLVIDDERFIVEAKPAANVALLDHPAGSTNAANEWQWLAAALELADIDTEGLQLDNTPPLSTFDDAIYHDARVWWIDTVAGNRGRLHFSAIGRPESYGDFRELTSDRERLERLVAWGGSLWAFSQEKIYQVQGGESPVVLQPIDGVPGTTRPYTVVATPLGIIYEASDGFRLFNGTSSALISDNIAPIFHGRTTDGLPVFDGENATSTDREYIVSDGTTVLAIDAAQLAWREPKIALASLEYIDSLEMLVAGRGSDLIEFESPDETQDGEDNIDFSIETPAIRLPSGILGIVQRLYIEADTQGQNVTPTLITSSGESPLPPFRTTQRETVEYALLRNTELVGVRLDASLDQTLRVFGVELDVYVPGE